MENKTKNLDPRRRASMLLFVVLLANFVRFTGISIIQIGLPSFILNLAGSLISYGLVIGIFNITQAIFQFPISSLSDKYGRRTLVLIGMVVYIIGTLLCFIATDIVQLLIFRAIQGAGAYSSILQAVVGDTYRKEEQGKGMALYSLTISLGYFVGTAGGGYFTFYFGFRSVFLITAILTLISAILILIFLKSPKKQEIMENAEDLIKPKITNKLEEIKLLIKDPQYQYAVILNCIRWFFFSAIIAYLIWVLQVHFQLNTIETSYLLIINIAIYTVFLLLAGRFVDKYGAKIMISLSQLAIILFGFLFVSVSLTDNLFIFIIATLLNALFFGVIQTGANTLLLQKISENNAELKGAGLGFANAIGFVFSAIGPIVLSVLGEIDLYLPYYFIMIVMVPGFFISYKLVK